MNISLKRQNISDLVCKIKICHNSPAEMLRSSDIEIIVFIDQQDGSETWEQIVNEILNEFIVNDFVRIPNHNETSTANTILLPVSFVTGIKIVVVD